MMVQLHRRRRGVVPLVLVSILMIGAAACSGSSPKATPAPGTPDQAERTPTPERTKPKVCELAAINAEACETALAVDDALSTGDIRGFDIDPAAKEAFDLVLGREEDLRVTAIGCPFAALALGCGPSFGIAVSSVPPGTDARNSPGITYALTFIRDAACDVSVIYTTGPPAGGPSTLCKPDGAAGMPLLSEVKFLTEDDPLNALVNGGLAQGGTLAGRPKGITDTHVRSEWFAYPDEPQTSVPDVLKGVPQRELVLTQPVPLDRMLFIATGCWGCDGPTNGLDRVYPLGGAIVKEELTLPPGGIRSIAVRPNTQEVILVTCQKDYCGDFGPAQTDLSSTVHRSLDGGVSWEAVASFEDYASVGAFTPDGYVVTVWTPDDNDPVQGKYSYYLMPGRTEVKPAPGTAEFGDFRVLADGQLAFQSEDGKRWLREDGSVAQQLPFDVDASRVSVLDIPGGSQLISWSVDLGGPRHLGYQVLWRNGAAQLAYVGNNAGWRVGQWLSDLKFVGNVFVSDKELGLPNTQMYEYERSVPAYVDLEGGTVTPIDTPFFEANYRMNRTYVVGAWGSQDLARVNTPGDCLNLREADSTVLTCLKHGVVVAVDPFAGAGPGLVRVFSPTGQLGYMAEEYLER